MRTLAITIFTFNVTFGAAWSVLVLYARERLGLGVVGFGLISTAIAVGGLLGTVSYGWLERHVRLGVIMRGGLIIETLTHLALALTRWAWFALIVFVIFGAHAFIWGTTSTSVRQRAVPAQFQGRVGSVYLTGVVGGMVIGSALGGLVASAWGVTAPFWFAFAGSALILALIWRSLLHIAHADEQTRELTPGSNAQSAAASALSTQVRRAARGTAPVCRAATCPRRSTSRVGMAWTPNRCETCGEVSTFTLTSLSLPARSRASCSSAGLTMRQGPHQGAHKSTTTGILAASATSPKVASSASAIHGSA